MAGALICITDAGRAALVAPGNTGTNAHKIVEIGLSTGWFDSTDRTLKKLPNELKRITTFGGDNIAFDTIHVTLRDDTADQYKLYGFGLYLENGVLAGVYCQKSEDGPIMEKAPAAMLLLSADLQFTTIDAAQLVFGNANFTNPPATTERQGVVELATQDEVNAGADDTRAVTPKTAAARYAALTGAVFTGPVQSYGLTSSRYGVNSQSVAFDAKSNGNFVDSYSTVNNAKMLNLNSTTDADNTAPTAGDVGINFSILGVRKAMLSRGGRFLFNTTIDDGTNAVQVNGSARIDGNMDVNRATNEGQIYLGPSDGYFFANANKAGWYSPTKGWFFFDFTLRNLCVGGSAVWHAGNLTPLDANKGGTLNNDVTFATGKRLWLSEGSAAYPSLTFINDADTGFYHINDGTFAVTCNGVTTVRFTPSVTVFDQPVTGPTPPAGEVSTRLATTEWVTSKIAMAAIGQIVMEPRTSARAGFLKANGAVLNRADYPVLWAYAQASGALVAESAWSGGNWGCFSSGDGATTFRIPELRGEHLRCWDDGRGVDGSRGIGSWQDSQNRWHAHGASAGAVGDHIHGAWTDAQGWHGHGVSDPGHTHQTYGQDPGFSGPIRDSAVLIRGDQGQRPAQVPTYPSGTGIGINGDGNHGHNIGMSGAGAHSHAITVNADGGSETRVRTVALLAMIRAY